MSNLLKILALSLVIFTGCKHKPEVPKLATCTILERAYVYENIRWDYVKVEDNDSTLLEIKIDQRNKLDTFRCYWDKGRNIKFTIVRVINLSGEYVKEQGIITIKDTDSSDVCLELLDPKSKFDLMIPVLFRYRDSVYTWKDDRINLDK